MTELGIHLPNRPLVPGELDRIFACGARDYVDLQYWPDRWQAVAAKGRLHIRVDERGDLDFPEDAAERLVSLALGHPEVWSWRVRNEPNLESPGVTPLEWQLWLTDFGHHVAAKHPWIPIFAPAISPATPDWLDWLDATVAAAKAADFWGLDAHAYGSPAEVAATLAAHRSRWDGPILVSEHNFGAGRAYDLGQYARDLPLVLEFAGDYQTKAVCLFIWEWEGGPDLPTTVNIKDTVVEDYLKERAMAYQVGPGVAAKLAERGDEAQSDEQWIGSLMSVTAGKDGLYIYVKQANRTYFLASQ